MKIISLALFKLDVHTFSLSSLYKQQLKSLHLSLSHKFCKVLIPCAQLDYPQAFLNLLQRG